MNPAVAILADGATAGLLVLSGGAQLASRAHSRQAMQDLRLPGALGTSGFLTAWALLELAVACGLLVAPAPVVEVAGLAAAGMFVAFLIVVTRAARFREPVRCHCFGALDTEPVGPATVARGWGLLALSLAALLGAQGGSILSQATDLSAADSGLLQLGLLLTGAIAVLHVMNRLRARPRPRHAAGTASVERAGDRGPATVREAYLPDLFGARHDVRRFVGPERSILVFLSAECGACAALAEQLGPWREALATRGIALRAVTSAPPAQAIAQYPRLGSYLHQDEHDTLADQVGVDTLPAAVYVGRDGTPSVSDGPAHGAHAITVLVDNALADAAQDSAPAPTEAVR